MHEEAAALELNDSHAYIGGHIGATQALLLLKAPDAAALDLAPNQKSMRTSIAPLGGLSHAGSPLCNSTAAHEPATRSQVCTDTGGT